MCSSEAGYCFGIAEMAHTLKREIFSFKNRGLYIIAQMFGEKRSSNFIKKIPDFVCTCGFIELKVQKEFPSIGHARQ